jgi:hypothetical protein
VLLAYAFSIYAPVAAASCPGGKQFCRASNGVRGRIGRAPRQCIESQVCIDYHHHHLTDSTSIVQVTIVCDDAEVGDTGVVDGVRYTKVARAGLFAMAGNQSLWPMLETSCTSGVDYMATLFLGTELFNENISGWDTSDVTDLLTHSVFLWRQNEGGRGEHIHISGDTTSSVGLPRMRAKTARWVSRDDSKPRDELGG